MATTHSTCVAALALFAFALFAFALPSLGSKLVETNQNYDQNCVFDRHMLGSLQQAKGAPADPRERSIGLFTDAVLEYAQRRKADFKSSNLIERCNGAALKDLAYLFPGAAHEWKQSNAPLGLSYDWCDSGRQRRIKQHLSSDALNEVKYKNMATLNEFLRVVLNECWHKYATRGQASPKSYQHPQLVPTLIKYMHSQTNLNALSKVNQVLSLLIGTQVSAQASGHLAPNVAVRRWLDSEKWTVDPETMTHVIKEVMFGQNSANQVIDANVFDKLAQPCANLLLAFNGKRFHSWNSWAPGYVGMLARDYKLSETFNADVSSKLNTMRMCDQLEDFLNVATRRELNAQP